jgi:hypothetical protein
MAHEFIPHEQEPEPQASGSRLGGPPRKHTAAGVLDPPFRPKKPVPPTPAIPLSAIFRLFVILILVSLAVSVMLMLWKAF